MAWIPFSKGEKMRTISMVLLVVKLLDIYLTGSRVIENIKATRTGRTLLEQMKEKARTLI